MDVPPGSIRDMALRAGLVLCCICFDAKPRGEMWVDSEGYTWDVCRACHAAEENALARKRASTASQPGDDLPPAA